MNKLKVYISVVVIVILSIPVVIIGATLLWFRLPYIYTPQALDSENYAVYKECIDFLKDCNEYKDVMWFRVRTYDLEKATFIYPGRVFTGSICQTFSDPTVSVERKIELLPKLDTKSETDSLRSDLERGTHVLSKKLREIRCARFYRHNDMVLFYKTCSKLGYPNGPGVLYSISGENPNNLNDNVISFYKPFEKIYGNWYMSRHLMLQGPRFILNHTSIPRSLFDHSLKTKGVSFSE